MATPLNLDLALSASAQSGGNFDDSTNTDFGDGSLFASPNQTSDPISDPTATVAPVTGASGTGITGTEVFIGVGVLFGIIILFNHKL